MKDRRTLLIIAAVVAAVLLLIAAVVFLSSSNADDSAGATTTSSPTATTSSTAPTTTEVPPDETTSTTTTTSPPSTTSTTSSSTTTTSTSTTSTTVVSTVVLDPDGIGGVPFGAPPDEAITFAEGSLGPADRDTGWVDSFSEYGTCPPPVVRGVEWGESPSGFGAAFILLFTQSPTRHKPEGGEHLFGYYYYGGEPILATATGMTVGTTLGVATAMYPEIAIFESPWDPGDGVWVIDDDPSDHTQLSGFATGQDDAALVTSILGGVTCGE